MFQENMELFSFIRRKQTSNTFKNYHFRFRSLKKNIIENVFQQIKIFFILDYERSEE